MFISKMLGGPKELTPDQVQRLYEIRRKFGMKGKHPADLCPNVKAGLPPCPNCTGDCGTQSAASSASGEADVIAEITKRVLAQLGK